MIRNSSGFPRTLAMVGSALLSLLLLPLQSSVAQQTGTVTGTVTRVEGGALSSVSVLVAGTGLETVTGTDGKYTLRRVPAGPQTVVFRWLGYKPTEAQVVVEPGSTVNADAALEAVAVSLGELVVEGASRAPDRITEAPAAISIVPEEQLQAAAVTGQAPIALQAVPGVDITQSGMNDFNVNARGFNSTLNRRVLVLQDGRDLAIAFLGSQEWNGMTQSLDDVSKVEMVRGPGSALYGANAFSGVVSITTPTAREVLGNRLTVAAGELETFRADGRHASVFADGRIGLRSTVATTAAIPFPAPAPGSTARRSRGSTRRPPTSRCRSTARYCRSRGRPSTPKARRSGTGIRWSMRTGPAASITTSTTAPCSVWTAVPRRSRTRSS